VHREYVREFAERNPKIAARLATKGSHSEDPHVERMLKSSALSSAGISKKIQDQYPEFTEALLEILFPQYLRTIPRCHRPATESHGGSVLTFAIWLNRHLQIIFFRRLCETVPRTKSG
jgi:type VI secretion system protein ImpG